MPKKKPLVAPSESHKKNVGLLKASNEMREAIRESLQDAQFVDGRLVYRLFPLLAEHNITAYRLAKESGISLSSVYAIKALPDRIHVGALVSIIAALRRLTGKDIRLHNLLEYQTQEELMKNLLSIKLIPRDPQDG
jgi:hypothetical protein